MHFDMGAYAPYIWAAYGISAVALGALTVWAVVAHARAKARLARLERK